jgi:hypothetical protein
MIERLIIEEYDFKAFLLAFSATLVISASNCGGADFRSEASVTHASHELDEPAAKTWTEGGGRNGQNFPTRIAALSISSVDRYGTFFCLTRSCSNTG